MKNYNNNNEEYMDVESDSAVEVPDSWEDYIDDWGVELDSTPTLVGNTTTKQVVHIPAPITSIPDIEVNVPVEPETISDEPILLSTSRWGSETVVVYASSSLDEEEYPTLSSASSSPSTTRPSTPTKHKRCRRKKSKAIAPPTNIYATLEEPTKSATPVSKPVSKKRVRGTDISKGLILTPHALQQRKYEERCSAFRAMADKKAMGTHLIRTKMCRFGKRCNRKVCTFAHSADELQPPV